MAEMLGWRWEFGVQVPVLILCLSICLVVIPGDIGLEARDNDAWHALREFDVKGSVLLALCTSSLIISLVSQGSLLESRTQKV